MIISNNTVKKYLDLAGKCLHAPEQKIILTATALGTQPIIELKNKNVDEKTKETAFARTIAKIIAGAASGIPIRYLGIWAAEKLTKFKPILDSTGKYITGVAQERGILVPKHLVGPNAFKPMLLTEFQGNVTRYIKAMGTLLATLTMIYTNFSFDTPVTNKGTPICKKMFHPFFAKYSEQNKESEAKRA